MDGFQFVEYQPVKPKRKTVTLPNTDKKSLAIRLRAVEFQLSKLCDLYKLNSKLTNLTLGGQLTPLDGELFRIPNTLRILLIDYLQWISHHIKLFKLKGLVKDTGGKLPLETTQFTIRLIKIRNFIQSFLAYDPNIALSPNNRGGRLCEYVETDIKVLNMGAILEQGMNCYDDFHLVQSSIFSRHEVITLLKSKGPNFISGVFTNFFAEFFRVEQCPVSINVTNAIYESTIQLFYEVYNNPGYNQLRALVFFLNSAISRCDYILIEKIFYAIVGIWQILNVDQIGLTKLLAGPNDYESSQTNTILQIWHHIWSLFLQNHHLFPFATRSFVLSNFTLSSISQLDSSKDILKSLSKIPKDHVGTFISLIIGMGRQMKRQIVQSYVKISLGLKNKKTAFKLSIFSKEEYKASQGLVNMFLKYTKHKFNSVFDLSEPICLDDLLILTSQPQHLLSSKIHSLILTVDIYCFQIHLLYPLVFTHPAPTKLGANELSLLLSTSLSFTSLMEIVIYYCFQKKKSMLLFDDLSDILLLSNLTDYLRKHPKPDIEENVKDKCPFIMKCHHFGKFLTIIYSFLNILCATNFSTLSLSYTALPSLIRFKIQNIIEILRVSSMFKRPDERIDVDMVIMSLKVNVPKFPVPDKWSIDWSGVL